MKTTSYSATGFSAGFFTGALGVFIIGTTLLYMLNMSEVVAISVLEVPSIQRVLSWTYENLRLSVIPFCLTFLLYTGSLLRLKRFLRNPSILVEKIAQIDHLVDIWINLFFGIGVIWTAIGMRSALLYALGDPAVAAESGAFTILTRLVDGGILTALTTTIVGGIGGYMMRVIKSSYLGTKLSRYYEEQEQHHAARVEQLLHDIRASIGDLSAPPSTAAVELLEE